MNFGALMSVTLCCNANSVSNPLKIAAKAFESQKTQKPAVLRIRKYPEATLFATAEFCGTAAICNSGQNWCSEKGCIGIGKGVRTQ